MNCSCDLKVIPNDPNFQKYLPSFRHFLANLILPYSLNEINLESFKKILDILDQAINIVEFSTVEYGKIKIFTNINFLKTIEPSIEYLGENKTCAIFNFRKFKDFNLTKNNFEFNLILELLKNSGAVVSTDLTIHFKKVEK